ncbi:hypothetical protein [Ralstonia sp. 1138]|uniref:hypothetical protein n=1 Tax=Ralstonia sp. 1138 TaxID=3156423 RepID=UPI0033997690
MTPIQLDRVLAACVSLNQMDNAALAFMLSGAYGYFDGLRVVDRSAHQAPKVMLMYTLGSLPNDKRQEFEKHLKAVMNDPQQKQKVCISVQSFGPPAYYPKYMIDHGMDAMLAAQSGATLPNRGLVDPFDAANAWRTAVKAYLLCEAP